MSKGGGVEIPDDYTFRVGGNGSTLSVDADLDNIHIREIAPVTVNSNLAVTRPIVTESTSHSDSTSTAKVDSDSKVALKIDPLKVTSDSTSAIDIKPLAIDSCQTLKLAPLPAICVEQPYTQHFGVTFMGVELWGLNISGRSEMNLHSPPKPTHHSVRFPAPHSCSGEPGEKPEPPRPRSGLRIRVK